MLRNITLLLLLATILSNCASDKSMYNWGNYEKSVHNYNKSPMEKEKFALKLLKIITKGEQNNQVPPGIYAEYAYIMLEIKNYDKAINYFKKEKQLWPESTQLMDIMIKRANLLKKNNKK